ncbi:MAG: sulfide/dihydroorotate dehydrogenase-like FAD/NAD-binding protein [Clostridiales bacterium]|nr:sulfide/dihydroorotate dehydrogenase-like FAD/NAD-binding protein [Clostridiales bacterium]
MYPIVKKRVLNEEVSLMEVRAPLAARHARPGQFIILRVDENGERIPLTIADFDREKGTVTVIFQKVGATTKLLDQKNEGDTLADFVGPLGRASEFDGVHRAAVIGGGLGVAIAYPQAKALKALGARVDLIVGFRKESLILLEDELKAASDDLTIMTDDGSNGHKGFVTDALRERLSAGKTYDEVIAIGPIPMMKAVCEMTRPYGIKTIVSMNSVMIDGTGMCGCCRLTVNGETRFACVDGPEFDGHEIDFDEAMARNAAYRDFERHAYEEACNLFKGVKTDA